MQLGSVLLWRLDPALSPTRPTPRDLSDLRPGHVKGR
jgi:hypothetical protein